ncbi:MAG TPA: DNA polymerase III subunit beta [Pseudogracilibacillus sp.]|nr:DNA polymerase III subunit beta [Pseudogracilibacillus sp.]
MKFVIKKQHLLKNIQYVVNAISSRTVIPILTGMKIDVRNNHVILTGSNSDITIQAHIPQKIDDEEVITNMREGTIILPVPHFPEIIKKLPEELVEITVDDELKATIRSGHAVFSLNGQSSEEYPQLPPFQSDDTFEISINNLKTLIKQTVFAVSTMETRPILTGVNVKLENKKLEFTATDSHRLALSSLEIEESEIDDMNIVIPGKSLQELSKILEDTDEKINVSLMKNQILFSTNNLFFLSRLLNGNYPETSRLIPDHSETTLFVDRRELIHTIERAALLANREQNNVVRLDTKEDNIIEVSSQSPEVGYVTEELNVNSFDGDDLKISFSSKYMLDTLKTIENEEVQINFTGAMRPFIIKVPNNESILQLILPVRTF